MASLKTKHSSRFLSKRPVITSFLTSSWTHRGKKDFCNPPAGEKVNNLSIEGGIEEDVEDGADQAVEEAIVETHGADSILPPDRRNAEEKGLDWNRVMSA